MTSAIRHEPASVPEQITHDQIRRLHEAVALSPWNPRLRTPRREPLPPGRYSAECDPTVQRDSNNEVVLIEVEYRDDVLCTGNINEMVGRLFELSDDPSLLEDIARLPRPYERAFNISATTGNRACKADRDLGYSRRDIREVEGVRLERAIAEAWLGQIQRPEQHITAMHLRPSAEAPNDGFQVQQYADVDLDDAALLRRLDAAA